MFFIYFTCFCSSLVLVVKQSVFFRILNFLKAPKHSILSRFIAHFYTSFDNPQYLKGEEISIQGRITAIADVFDALGSRRCYKDVWKDEDIFEYFKQEKGNQFDPNLVDIFFEHLDEFLSVREKFIDE